MSPLMKLPEYIREMGIEAFAKRYNVTERAARAYQQRQRRPKPDVAQRIVDDSPVTWEGIYAPDRAPDQAAAP